MRISFIGIRQVNITRRVSRVSVFLMNPRFSEISPMMSPRFSPGVMTKAFTMGSSTVSM